MAKDAEGPRKSDFLAVPSDTYQRITSRLSQQQRQPITQNSSSEELEETLRTLQSYLEERQQLESELEQLLASSPKRPKRTSREDGRKPYVRPHYAPTMFQEPGISESTVKALVSAAQASSPRTGSQCGGVLFAVLTLGAWIAGICTVLFAYEYVSLISPSPDDFVQTVQIY